MLKIMRKFSIKPTKNLQDEYPDLELDKAYPVLAIYDNEDETSFLIADDAGEFRWVRMSNCFLASIDG